VSQDVVKSTAWNEKVFVTFKNESDETVDLIWLDYSGNPVSYGTINAGETKNMNTYATHPWKVTSRRASARFTVNDELVYIPVASDDGKTIIID